MLHFNNIHLRGFIIFLVFHLISFIYPPIITSIVSGKLACNRFVFCFNSMIFTEGFKYSFFCLSKTTSLRFAYHYGNMYRESSAWNSIDARSYRTSGPS